MATDFERFISEAQGLRGGFFDRARPITAARAPGWVDLLGGAAADGGALALGWPLGRGAFVALQPSPEPAILLRDTGGAQATIALEALALADGAPRAYEDAAARLAGQPAPIRLAASAWLALLREEFARFPGGARLLVHNTDSPGWQIALVAAVAQALVSAFGVRLAPRELGLSCREGLVRTLGADHDPGALGALVSVCAPGGALLLLHQQPAWMWGSLHLPPGAAIWALRVGPGPRPDGAVTRAATAMAFRTAAAQEVDGRWRGYLGNVGSAHFESRLRSLLPESFGGDEFLAQYGQPPGVTISPSRRYPLRAAAALAVEEHLRARTAAALLRGAAGKEQHHDELTIVGELLARSHWGQRAAGIEDPHADRLAALVADAGPARGLFGSRAPAPASGATLVVLGRQDAEPALRMITTAYAAECGLPVTLFGDSSSGCSPAGTREI
jgi:hypothetical protein